MRFIPYGDQLSVEQHKAESKVIHLADDEVRRRPLGTVLELGDGYNVQTSGIKQGDTVVFNEQAGERVAMGEKEFLVVKLKDILGRIYAD